MTTVTTICHQFRPWHCVVVNLCCTFNPTYFSVHVHWMHYRPVLIMNHTAYATSRLSQRHLMTFSDTKFTATNKRENLLPYRADKILSYKADLNDPWSYIKLLCSCWSTSRTLASIKRFFNSIRFNYVKVVSY